MEIDESWYAVSDAPIVGCGNSRARDIAVAVGHVASMSEQAADVEGDLMPRIVLYHLTEMRS